MVRLKKTARISCVPPWRGAKPAASGNSSLSAESDEDVAMTMSKVYSPRLEPWEEAEHEAEENKDIARASCGG